MPTDTRAALKGKTPMMIRLVPKIFFNRMDEGLDLFVNALGFKVLHQDSSLAVVGKDGAKAYIVESPEYAAKDRPEIAIETDDIEEIYRDISARRPDVIHPNLPRVTKRPWGALEFSLLDKTGVCVVFRQWPVAPGLS
jgi:hypothetical protein